MLQQDERYISYVAAREKNDEDEDLQQLINDFSELRLQLDAEMSKSDKNSEKIAALDSQIKEQYNKVMSNENMINFTKAKNEMDSLLSQINTIITYSANGEDPMTCPAVNLSSCAGSCESCGGCG